MSAYIYICIHIVSFNNFNNIYKCLHIYVCVCVCVKHTQNLQYLHTHTHTHTHKEKESKHNTKDSHQSKRREQNKIKGTKKKNKMTVSTHLSIITLILNGWTTPIKGHRVTEWIKKQDPYINMYFLQETHFRSKDRHRIKVRRWKSYSMQMETKRKLGLQFLYETK